MIAVDSLWVFRFHCRFGSPVVITF